MTAATLDPNSVALYLEDNPQFFEERPELLTGLRLNSQLGGRTVSLQDRQVEVLREKVRVLELKLATLTRIGKDNDAIIEKFHKWVHALLLDDANRAPQGLVDSMRTIFNVPAASLRVWEAAPAFHGEAWVSQGDDSAARSHADSLIFPYCGPNAKQAGVQWLEGSEGVQSVALVPLRKQGATGTFGLLVLGSQDPQRFSTDMGTDFLDRIGQIASAALEGLLD